MAIGDTDVELEYTNVAANVPIVVGIQNTGVDTEILVRYGIQRFTATLGVDYSLVFPVDLLTFQLTPTQSLMDKLLAAGPTNVIYVQRVLPLTSDFDYDNAFVRQKLVDEFNRVWMVLQQEDFRLGLASPVTSWNERTGDVHLFLTDITDVGGAPVANPHFIGVPLAPTAAPGTDTTQIATVEFVNNAVEVGVTLDAVTSFNGRQGNVSLQLGDVTGVGGAPIAGPAFTGSVSFAGPVAFATSPTAPTPATADSSTKVATTAYVGAAVAAISSGVVSWNGRVGVVTMTLADITGVGGAAASAIPVASVAIPVMDGTAIAGVATAWARGDHVHPTDTSRLAVSAASATDPVMDGVAAPGAAASYSRGDHVHPVDTSRVAKAGDTMTGNLVLNIDPIVALGAATKQYVDAAIPVGAIIPYAASVAPSGWAICNGSNVSRAANPILFSRVGVAYGAGDTTTTFGLPDLRGRVPAGVDAGAGRLVTGYGGGMASVTLAGIGGESAHTPTQPEGAMHSHSHSHLPSGGGGNQFRTNGVGAPYATTSSVGNLAISSTDTDASAAASYANALHNNIQPTLVVQYIIRLG